MSILSTNDTQNGPLGLFVHDGPIRLSVDMDNFPKSLPLSESLPVFHVVLTEPHKTIEIYDPVIPILGWFDSLPAECHEALFADFEAAALSRDLRSLLGTFSDWAATAELYASPEIAEEVREAIGGREGVLDWLNG